MSSVSLSSDLHTELFSFSLFSFIRLRITHYLRLYADKKRLYKDLSYLTLDWKASNVRNMYEAMKVSLRPRCRQNKLRNALAFRFCCGCHTLQSRQLRLFTVYLIFRSLQAIDLFFDL